MNVKRLRKKGIESKISFSLTRHWSKPASSAELELILKNIIEKHETYEGDGILVGFCEYHPTFDFLSIRFGNSNDKLEITHAVFYNMTTSREHDLNINAHFIDYVHLLLNHNNSINFEFYYVTSDCNYKDFKYYKTPKDENDLNEKLKNLEINNKKTEPEYNAFSDYFSSVLFVDRIHINCQYLYIF